jgi:UDP-N-acetylmuramate--alanine ligase
MKVHLLGIGGSGMSALARLWLTAGARVSGSDLAKTATTEALTLLGAQIKYEQSLAGIPADAETIVYSAALEVAEPALIAELKKTFPKVLSYSEALGELARAYQVIAVAGTHGKTTTTAMLSHILQLAGLSPTVILGGEVQGSGSNFRTGTSDYLVVEADEYRRSFLSLHPFILVVTNIDADHLDFYRDLGEIQAAFGELAARVPPAGKIICNPADPHLAPVMVAAQAPILDYEQVNLVINNGLHGEHNRQNARAAICAAGALGVGVETARAALLSFPGVRRRFEYAGQTPAGALLYHDYAHNPPKVKAALAGAREHFPTKRLVVAFQPHLYSRTKALLPEFAEALSGADQVLLTPIYAAREAPDTSVNSPMLAEAVKKLGISATAHPDLASIAAYLRGTLGPEDVLIAMGAGDIYRLIEYLV